MRDLDLAGPVALRRAASPGIAAPLDSSLPQLRR